MIERSASPSVSPAEHTFVFVGGLHRSGTTLLASCLAAHPAASGFADTGAIEDEGQFLQSVYPIARQYGGPGRFGYAPAMHLTENSPLVTETNRQRLWAEWSKFWDYRRPILIEKSPPNLLKARFLQAMFPDARFIMVLRHPIANAFATQKWSGTRLHDLIKHWLVCNEIMLTDMRHLRRVTLLRYEDLIANGDAELSRLHAFVGLEPQLHDLKPREGLNDNYFDRWDSTFSPYRKLMIWRFEKRVNHFGYSLRHPKRLVKREIVLDRLVTAKHDAQSAPLAI